MKSVLVLAFIVVAATGVASAPPPFRSYKPLPPVEPPRSNGRVVADARNAVILKYVNDINPDGSYTFSYETDNGIAAQEQGTPREFSGNPPVRPDVAQGSFSYTSPEGQLVSISYIADENGFQPQGDVIPTPPPVPAQILRALEYIAKNAPRK